MAILRLNFDRALSIILILLPQGAIAESCDMAQVAAHSATGTKIFGSISGEKALLFTSDLDVNTDGAARSYHPDDPRGTSLALNNMGNAITRIFDADGKDVTCSPRSGECFTRFMKVFEAARDAKYEPTGHPRVETGGIVPWVRDASLGWDLPCTIATGPYKGYFVAQTALLANPRAGICDPSRYVDALSMNAIVLPRKANWSSQGVRTD